MLAICIFLSLLLAWGDSQSDGSWRKFLALGIAPLDAAVAEVGAAFRLREQAAHLAAELARSRQEVWQGQELIKENERLTSLLALRSSLSYDSLPARVINYQTDGLRSELTLDVGEMQGAQLNMAVIAPQGLVGRVVRVYPNTSLVRLIIDPEERVSCRVYDSRSFCILRTDELGRIRLDYLSVRNPIEKGEAVVTSGQGGVYPAGVPVGSVDTLEISSEQLFYSATLKPYVDFGTLEVVVLAKPELKIKWEVPTMPNPVSAPAPQPPSKSRPLTSPSTMPEADKPPATPSEPPAEVTMPQGDQP